MSKETSQKQRRLNALSSEYFKVDDRSLSDLYKEVQGFARMVKFYPDASQETTEDWTSFFKDAEPYIRHLSILASDPNDTQDGPKDCPPHLALVLSFLKLFSYTQQRLNDLTYTHLNYFYNKVLGEQRRNAIPDKVYLFAELAKNESSYVLTAGEKFLAGKDEKKRNILYSNERTISLNHARIARLMSVQRSSPDNRIYSFPISNSSDGWGKPLEEGEGWFPFGDLTKLKVPVEIGFGFASPLLLLKEGKRRISVTFNLEVDRKKNIIHPPVKSDHFELQVTSLQGWINKKLKTFQLTDKTLEISFDMDEMDPSLTSYDQSVHGYDLRNLNFPILKIILTPTATYEHYKFLQTLRFSRVTIKTDVRDTQSFILRNDYGELDSEKQFHPFGFTPLRGSNFYVTLPESTGKPLDSITLKLQWKGLPESFKNYYEGYMGATNSLVRTNEDFKVRAAIRIQKKWIELNNENDSKGEYALFSEEIVLKINMLNKVQPVGHTNDEDLLIRLTLTSPAYTFGHSLYPVVYAKAIISQLQNKEAPIPNEPFTPIVESVRLSYTATELIDLASQDTSLRYFHFKPFGVEETSGSVVGQKTLLVSGEGIDAGNLCIGIDNITVPQQITLFFEIIDDSFTEKPDPSYYFLSGNGWRRFSASHVLSDTTGGLKQTGIIIFNLPREITMQNPSMPTGYFWIKISVSSSPESFDKILSVRTNAFICSAYYEAGQSSGTINALPPLSVSGPLNKIKQIKKIEQPFSSFGGKPEETVEDYFVRSSEMLRHKMRGISAWDIERIILEEFPEIYKAKCIPHEDENGNRLPGSIHVIVIPYIQPRNPLKFLRPFTPHNRLKQIEEHVRKLISPQAELSVTNPIYEEIKVAAQINFRSQSDSGYYIRKLQDDIKSFLSPWAFKGDIEIELGSKMYKSSIIEFIESLPYVNYISSIQLLKNGEEVEDQLIELDERTILISSNSHDLEAVSPEWSKCQTNQGIEEMIIDINFEVQ